jgi:hypothetical protein
MGLAKLSLEKRRLIGRIGGTARWESWTPAQRKAHAKKANRDLNQRLTAEQRSARGRKAILTRWAKYREAQTQGQA